MLRISAIVIVALVATLGTAVGHVETFSDTRTVIAGDYVILLEPYPTPLYENSTLSMSGYLTHRPTGRSGANAAVTLDILGPSDYTRTVRMGYDPSNGYHHTSMVVEGRGNYTVAITIVNSNGTRHEGVTWLDVYPDLPYRIRAKDTTQDLDAGLPMDIPLDVSVRAGGTQGPPLTDLRARIERWSDDHKTMLGTADVPVQQTDGNWHLAYTFPQGGMYHIWFASDSGGFDFRDVPMLHLTARGILAPPKETPAPEPVALLALVGMVALAISLRRR